MDKKILREMRFMMERLESPRMTDTELKKRYKKLLKEEENPESITIELTGSGKNKMDLKNTPTSIRMTSDKSNPQMGSDYYYIGNTEFKLGVGANIYFAQYRHDIKEILVSYLVPKSSEEFTKLVNSQYISPREMKGSISSGNHKFDNGIKVGEVDHRGDFEIVKVD